MPSVVSYADDDDAGANGPRTDAANAVNDLLMYVAGAVRTLRAM